MADQIVIAGHSHVFVYGFNSTTPEGVAPGLIRLPFEGVDVFGFSRPQGPYEDSYWNDLVEKARDQDIVLVWLGSQHLAEFLFEPDEPFDLVLASRPDLPVATGATLVPESLVRDYEATFLAKLGGIVDRLKARPGCRVFVSATPPPKGDDAALRANMMREPYFQARAAASGLDIGTVPFTPPALRLKLWLVIQDLLRETAETHGVPYLPVPPESRDETGFLRPDYWENDVGHANAAYGRLAFAAARHHIGESTRRAAVS